MVNFNLSSLEIQIDKELSTLPTNIISGIKSKLLGTIFYNTIKNFHTNSTRSLSGYFMDCQLISENFESLIGAVNQLREIIYKIPVHSSPLPPSHFMPVRLKGQEKLHAQGMKCTEGGVYTGDDGDLMCILDRSIQPTTPYQKFGYQEIFFDLLEPKTLYTQRLGPCIGILLVGIKHDGTVKGALMHEDYSEPEGSVTEMFMQSFQSNLKDYNELKFFLLGGNGGQKFTSKRFNIHRSEFAQLCKEYGDLLPMNFCFSTDELNSFDIEYNYDESHVFLTSHESSVYLWILHQSSYGESSLQKICINGKNLSLEQLAAYYQEKVLPLLQPSQNSFKKFAFI